MFGMVVNSVRKAHVLVINRVRVWEAGRTTPPNVSGSTPGMSGHYRYQFYPPIGCNMCAISYQRKLLFVLRITSIDDDLMIPLLFISQFTALQCLAPCISG